MYYSALKFIQIILLIIISATSLAQRINGINTRTKTISLSGDTIIIDTLTIVKGSLKTIGNAMPSGFYLDETNSRIIIKSNTQSTTDRITIQYKVYSEKLNQAYHHKNYLKIENPGLKNYNEFAYNPDQNKIDYFQTDKLNKNGSISRGVNFGNNQDLVVNSQLNLQLNGQLSENIGILAAIADDNIPIQADGNTQQLQEFDKVYIQLFDKRSKLTVGDYFLVNPKQSYFSIFNKRNQGGMFSSKILLKDTTKQIQITTAAATSRGRFNRYKLPIVEGNQGFYQLRGADNELFVIVLSGSEKVYMDGKLMTRGLEFDYVIDYNLAQIRFMPKIQITKDRRVYVEFQYSDKNYARSILQFGTEYYSKQTKAFFNIYTEQDNKNKPLLQSLNDNQKAIMSSVGDSINQAVDYTIDTIDFNPSIILYEQVDTMIEGRLYDKIFKYSTNPDKAIFRLSFSDVGTGNGNYMQAQSSANGKVFFWVAPLNGKRQGQFEPVIQLITPKKRTMINIGLSHKIDSLNTIEAEAAYSNNNVNTFSKKDLQNDNGIGLKTSWSNPNLKRNENANSIKLRSNISYEFIDKNFIAIERFRTVEFDRDWNLNSRINIGAQHLLSASVGVVKNQRFSFDYTFSNFSEIKYYQGRKQSVNFNYRHFGWNLNGIASALNARTIYDESSFLRHKVVASKTINKSVVIGASEEQEINQFIVNKTGIKSSNTNFFEWQIFTSSVDTSHKWYRLKYINREDKALKNNLFTPLTQAETYQAELGYNSKKNQQFKSIINFRKLAIIDSTITVLKPENTLLSRQEVNLSFFKGFISTNNFYEFGSGLETKKEYSYVEVAAGQGLYTWNDYNENGIKELNEFEIAVFKDKAKFIRVFTPSNQFVKAYSNQLNQTLIINPSVRFQNNKHGLLKFISKFYNQTMFRIERKTGKTFDIHVLNPFSNTNLDAQLVTLNQQFRNTITYNRNNPKYAIEYTYTENKSKTLLINGSEQRQLNQHSVKVRFALTTKFTATVDGNYNAKSNSSEFFSNRNYNIKTNEILPSIIFQPNVRYRISVNYNFKEKQNTIPESKSSAIFNNLSADAKYNVSGKSSLQCKFTLTNIKLNKLDVNSPVGFEMLESLQAGNNYLWNLTYQQSLTSNLQMSFSYDGRKSKNSRMIHNGGLQIRAIF